MGDPWLVLEKSQYLNMDYRLIDALTMLPFFIFTILLYDM
jgi:hypothetical protein